MLPHGWQVARIADYALILWLPWLMHPSVSATKCRSCPWELTPVLKLYLPYSTPASNIWLSQMQNLVNFSSKWQNSCQAVHQGNQQKLLCSSIVLLCQRFLCCMQPFVCQEGAQCIIKCKYCTIRWYLQSPIRLSTVMYNCPWSNQQSVWNTALWP